MKKYIYQDTNKTKFRLYPALGTPLLPGSTNDTSHANWRASTKWYFTIQVMGLGVALILSHGRLLNALKQTRMFWFSFYLLVQLPWDTSFRVFKLLCAALLEMWGNIKITLSVKMFHRTNPWKGLLMSSWNLEYSATKSTLKQVIW